MSEAACKHWKLGIHADFMQPCPFCSRDNELDRLRAEAASLKEERSKFKYAAQDIAEKADRLCDENADLTQQLAAANRLVEKMREAVQGWIDEHESHGPCQCEDAHYTTPAHSTPAYSCPSCSWNASLAPLRAVLFEITRSSI